MSDYVSLVGGGSVFLQDLVGVGVVRALDLGQLDQLGRALDACHVRDRRVVRPHPHALVEAVPARWGKGGDGHGLKMPQLDPILTVVRLSVAAEN